MPKKKSIKKSAATFKEAVEENVRFVQDVGAAASKKAHVSRLYDAGIIALYRDFESLVLDVLSGAINNDTSTVGETLGIDFPKHLKEEVCRYLVTGPSYFDFKGREGLIRRVKQYVPADHFLVSILKKPRYKTSIERLCALRNHAAHQSTQSKKAALKAVGQARMSSAGSWLKSQGRFDKIAKDLKKLGQELENAAPF